MQNALAFFPLWEYQKESGDVAQLGERHVRNVEVVGSNPIISTNPRNSHLPFIEPGSE